MAVAEGTACDWGVTTLGTGLGGGVTGGGRRHTENRVE